MEPEKKKHKGCLIGLILILILIIIGILYLSIGRSLISKIEAERYEPEKWYTDEPTGFASLDESEQNVYKRIVLSFDAGETEIDLSGFDIAFDKIEKICEAVLRDHPEYFWIESYSCMYDKDTQLIKSLTVKTNCTEEERQVKQEKINSAVSEIKKSIAPEMDDYEKVKTVHDAIIRNTEYGYDSADNQNICSVFIDHQSVCAGYSKALQYILKDLGIFSTLVYGEGNGENHGWNLVVMDGSPYYVDVTWDDPSYGILTDAGMDVLYDYFGITTEEIQRDHIADDSYTNLPECTAKLDNYFYREGRLYDSGYAYSADLILNVSSGADTFCGKLSDPDDIENAVSAIQLTGGSVMRAYGYSKNERQGVLYIHSIVR